MSTVTCARFERTGGSEAGTPTAGADLGVDGQWIHGDRAYVSYGLLYRARSDHRWHLVLDDIFHFRCGSDVDDRNLEAVRRANDEAKMKAARRSLQAGTEMSPCPRDDTRQDALVTPMKKSALGRPSSSTGHSAVLTRLPRR